MLKIKRGLDIPIDGEAQKNIVDATFVGDYAVQPPDFVGLTPRLQVAEGDTVECGQPLVSDKADPRVALTSPVSGTVKAVVRGEKRALLAVVVASDGRRDGCEVDTGDLRAMLLRTGMWSLLKRRPFGTIPSPDGKPKSLFVSCFDSAPLAPDYDFVLAGRDEDLAAGLQALSTLTDGETHVCVRPWQRLASVVRRVAQDSDKIVFHEVVGPHPAGNVGTQINRIDPINKGDEVWTVGVQEAAMIGRTLLTGVYNPVKTVAVAGPAASHPQYYKIRAGVALHDILSGQIANPDYPVMSDNAKSGVRVVSGNVLTGSNAGLDGYLGARDSMVTLLPEGDQYDFMGWLMPGLKKYSFSRTFISGMLHDMLPKNLNFQFSIFNSFNTNVHGSVRPFLFTGSFEQVFPFDIYPLQLIKACIVGDVELQEKLGIYEVEPEDFALCEFIDPSKTEIQTIIREALEVLRKEAIA